MLLAQIAGLEKLTLEWPTLDFSGHFFGQITFPHRANDPRHFAGGMDQVSNQRVNTANGIGPTLGYGSDRNALTDPTFFANDAYDSFQLTTHPFVGSNDVVEGVGDLAAQAGPILREANRKVAPLKGCQRHQQL